MKSKEQQIAFCDGRIEQLNVSINYVDKKLKKLISRPVSDKHDSILISGLIKGLKDVLVHLNVQLENAKET